MLKDKKGYQLGVTPRTLAHLSDPEEAQKVGVDLSQIVKLYGKDFIKFKGNPAVYQHIASPEAYNFITGGDWKLIKELPNLQELQNENELLKRNLEEANKTIDDLRKKLGAGSLPEDEAWILKIFQKLKDWIRGIK